MNVITMDHNTNSMRLVLRRVLLLLNFEMVVFLSSMSAMTILKISQSTQARDFLGEISHIPPVPWTIPLYSIGGFVLLAIVLNIKDIAKVPQWIVISLQIILGLSIIYSLDMNYNGIIFLVAAYLLDYFKLNKKKLVFIVIVGISLLIFDFNICEKFMPIMKFDTYTTYYKDIWATVFVAIKNLGTTCNIVLFIAYTILMLGEQIDENEKINDLNERLNDANAELKIANIELENYAKESEKIAQTRERNRLAREIHDTLGHTLTGIIAGLDAAIAILPISVEQTNKQLDMIRDVARRGMTDVRRSVNALRPDVLEREDLLEAINHTISDMSAASNVKIAFNNTIDQLRFSEDEEEIIYRIIQESVTNSIRHGKATEITIDLKKEYSLVTISITDNGKGSDNIKYGFGLTHMKERLDMLRGELYVESKNGFSVVAKIPIRWGEDND